jgi:hypothetical protein
MTQKEAILQALQNGERLTPLIALERFQSMSLSQTITKLKRTHPNIQSRMIATLNGKHVAEYYIDPAC